MVSLSVAGSAHHLHPAERGTIRLEARHESADRVEAVEAVAAVHTRLTAEAARHQETGAATRWSAEQVRASSYVRYDGGPENTVTVHVASASVRVRFSDFEALAAWVAQVSSEPDITVDGIEWSLTDASRAAAEKAVRIEAVRDAQERANAYADALSLSRTVVVRLVEPDAEPDRPQPKGMMMRSAAFDSGASALELTPEPIAVAATVSVLFEAY
ncbi:SIMPL domain-containing protein [Microbacteriaceae bacterium VKM Ac-2855]|nr:SIMPL domain-containing protein [Microbacteriaceae bacterium VKM Ac-2855]